MSRLLATLALALLAACGAEPEAGDAGPDVEEVVRGVVESIGAREVEGVMRHVALGFRGGVFGRDENLGYADVGAIALEFLLREHPLSARIESLDVEPRAPDGSQLAKARVWFDTSEVLADPASAVPESATSYRFELRFERREGTWQAVHALYERLDAPSPPSGG